MILNLPSCVGPSHIASELVCTIILLRQGYKWYCRFYLDSLSASPMLSFSHFIGFFALDKASCLVRKTLQRGRVVGNWSLQAIATQMSFGSGSSRISQVYRRLQPWLIAWLKSHERSWTKTILLSHSQIPDCQKMWEIINICCYKLICFRVICHTAVYSLYPILLLTSKETCHLHSITLSQSFDVTLILVSGVQSFVSVVQAWLWSE